MTFLRFFVASAALPGASGLRLTRTNASSIQSVSAPGSTNANSANSSIGADPGTIVHDLLQKAQNDTKTLNEFALNSAGVAQLEGREESNPEIEHYSWNGGSDPSLPSACGESALDMQTAAIASGGKSSRLCLKSPMDEETLKDYNLIRDKVAAMKMKRHLRGCSVRHSDADKKSILDADDLKGKIEPYTWDGEGGQNTYKVEHTTGWVCARDWEKIPVCPKKAERIKIDFKALVQRSWTSGGNKFKQRSKQILAEFRQKNDKLRQYDVPEFTDLSALSDEDLAKLGAKLFAGLTELEDKLLAGLTKLEAKLFEARINVDAKLHAGWRHAEPKWELLDNDAKDDYKLERVRLLNNDKLTNEVNAEHDWKLEAELVAEHDKLEDELRAGQDELEAEVLAEQANLKAEVLAEQANL